MKCFHLPIKKGSTEEINHVNADLVERLIPDGGGTVVCLTSGDRLTTTCCIDVVLKRIANANALHSQNGNS